MKKPPSLSPLLDEQSRKILEIFNAMEGPHYTDLRPEDLRAGHEAFFGPLSLKEDDLAEVEERFITGIDKNQIRIRIYKPKDPKENLPVALFYHGGGLMVGSLELYDTICQRLCARSETIIVSVDYRLAPEHKFPAAHNDSYSALEWVAQNAVSIGANPEKIAVTGDSGGGLLAAAMTQRSRAENGPNIVYQQLIYPALGKRKEYGSYEEFAEGYFGSPEQLAWFYDQYLTCPEDALNPQVSPILETDLSGLPPAFILTAGHDILRDEAEHYAALLQEAKVDASLSRYDSTFHPFLNAAGAVDVGKTAIDECAIRLKVAMSQL